MLAELGLEGSSNELDPCRQKETLEDMVYIYSNVEENSLQTDA